MGNFIDYIKWRGDISMEVYPLNDIDVLALTILSYGIFEGIADESEKAVSIKTAAKKYRELHPEEPGDTYDLLNTKTFGPFILYVMENTERFGNLKISHYVDVFDENESIQFSAYQVETPGKNRLMIFRGTDSAIDGWREDFAISYTEVGAQKLSYEYLNKYMEEGYNYIISGHSKGGNLAEYAAMECDDKLKPLIDKIYSFDGPGMCPEFINVAKYSRIKQKIIRVAPGYSVVGMLFRDSNPDIIVKSSGSAILQHSGFTWLLEGTKFITLDDLEPAAAEIHKTIDEWINDETLEQRQKFTDELFNAFKAGGAIDIQGVAAGGIEGVQKIVKSLTSLDKDAKEVTIDLVKQAAGDLTDNIKKTTKESFGSFLLNIGIWYAAISMVIGVFFLGFPKLSQNLIGIGFFAQLIFCAAFVIVTSIIFKKNKLALRIVLLSLVIIASVTCIVCYQTWAVSSGIIIAFMFFVMCGVRVFNYIKRKETVSVSTKRLWIVDACFSFVLAITDLVFMSVGYLEYFLKPAGMYLIIMSLTEFFRDYMSRELKVYKS